MPITRPANVAIRLPVLLLSLLMLCLCSHVQAADSVEFLNGSKIDGKLLNTDKDEKRFEFESKIGSRTIKQTYTYDQVHAVTFGTKRFVLTPKSSASVAGDSTSQQRTRQEVMTLIQQVGSRDPDWLASTKLTHPSTLDLSWPLKPGGKWNESKNVGQYIWGRVNPNPARWRPGIKLVHLCADEHQGSSALLKRDWEKLGEMYFTLLQDYARAAYWFQKAKVSVTKPTGIHLAECYWRLGNKAMAAKLLRARSLHFDSIKLLGDMGDVKRALSITSAYANSSVFNQAFLSAGDALRGAERYDEAIDYYQKVLDRNQARNPEYLKRLKARASGSIEAIRLFEQDLLARLPDGTYNGSAEAYNGRLDVAVSVTDQRIDAVKVTQHREKQFYAALTDTPR
ncbi:MAG: hypothetical protein AAGA03_12105 [Planctomycetota bacterium]